MAIDINDIDLDDDLDQGLDVNDNDALDLTVDDLDDLDSNSGDFDNSGDDDEPLSDSAFIDALLDSLNIPDRNSIKFVEDDGTVQEESWDNLTNEEKFNILIGNQLVTKQEVLPSDADNLYPDELELINYIRERLLTPEEYVRNLSAVGHSETLEFNIDSLDDEALFYFDLQTKVDGISDDELVEAYNAAAQNEELFKKQMDGIRNQYKTLEAQRMEELQLAQQYEYQLRTQLYIQNLHEGISSFDNLGGIPLDVDEDEQEEIIDFMTATDVEGVPYIQRALQEPETAARAAWFLLHGEETILGLNQYYQSEISKAAQIAYLQGLQQASMTQPKPMQSRVYKNKSTTANKENKTLSINDLD